MAMPLLNQLVSDYSSVPGSPRFSQSALMSWALGLAGSSHDSTHEQAFSANQLTSYKDKDWPYLAL